jgi:phasin family protein
VKQAEITKAGFEQAVAKVREITDLVQKSNTEVAALIQGRFVAQIDEVKAAIAKVAQK